MSVTEEASSATGQSRKKQLVKKLVSLVGTTDWNLDLALFLTLINFVWFVHILFDGPETVEGDFFEYFWYIFTSLGILLLPSSEEKCLHFQCLQLIVCLCLIWGVYSKKRSFLEFWMFFIVCTGVLNGWWNLNKFLLWTKLRESMEIYLCGGALLVLFYISAAFYVYRILILHSKIEAEKEEDILESFSLDCQYKALLTIATGFTLFGLSVALSHSMGPIGRLGSVETVLSTIIALIGLLAVLSLGLTNGYDSHLLKYCMWLSTFFWDVTVMAQFIWILRYDYDLRDMYSIIIARFLILDFPLMVCVFTAWKRNAQLARMVREETYDDSCEDFHRV